MCSFFLQMDQGRSESIDCNGECFFMLCLQKTPHSEHSEHL